MEYQKSWLYRDWVITIKHHAYFDNYQFDFIGDTTITKIKTYNSEEVYKTLMNIYKNSIIVFMNVFIIRENFKINSVSYKFYTKVLNLVFPKLNNEQQINLYNHLKENL